MVVLVLVLFLGVFLTVDVQMTVRQCDLDVVLAQAGQIGRDVDGVVRFCHVDLGRQAGFVQSSFAEGSQIKALETVVEVTTHLGLNGRERIAALASSAEFVFSFSIPPGNQFSNSHFCTPSLTSSYFFMPDDDARPSVRRR